MTKQNKISVIKPKEVKSKQKEKDRQDYIDKINDFHQDYYWSRGLINWRNIIS